jgi:HK97 family phage portal protein
MFPEIRNWLKERFSDRGELTALNLKNLSFDTVTVADVFPSGMGAEADWYFRNDYSNIAAALGAGLPSWSGMPVSRNAALQHPVVWACNGIVAGSIGFIPAMLMQRKGASKRQADDHPMYSAMLNAPNEEITAQGFTELLTSHCLLDGGGFAKIIRRSGTGAAIGLQPLLPEQMVSDREKGGQKRLVYIIKKEDGSVDKTYTVEPGKPHDILHLRGLGWDGIKGYSVIQYGRQSIGTALAGEHNVAKFWAGGGRVPYVLQKAKFRDDTHFQDFRKKWTELYAQPHLPPILEGDTEYKQIGLSMRDAQAIEFRQAEIAEICRWFSVSPHLVGDLSRATFSNIEQLALDFVKMTLARWLTRWEGDFWRCVLTPEEKSQGYFLRHNIRELLRGDFKTRMEGYASALQNGHMSIDEVRDDNDMNPLPDGIGGHYHIQVNQGTLITDGQIQPATPGPSILGLDQQNTN